MRVAVIDIGTVTARLAVADVERGRVVRLAKSSTICNLGQDVDATGELRQDAMERVFACVGRYVESAREAGAEAVCCTLTSAARDARNSRELGAALDSAGVEPLIIPGEVEGALTFLGVAQDFRGRRILVADNGGGSTELACGRLGADGALELDFVQSLNVGCRRVAEKFLSPVGPDDPEALAAAHAFAAEAFAPAIEAGGLRAGSGEKAPELLVVTGGTSTTLVAMSKGLDPYDPSRVHLAPLLAEKVAELEGRLAALTVAERAELPGVEPKRAPVLLGGTCIVGELLAQTGFDAYTVSESDLLFGLSLVAAATLDGAESPVVWQPALRTL